MPKLSARLPWWTRKVPAAAAAGWAPTDLSGLYGWWKKDTGLTLTGSDVDAWADQSGNGYTLTSNLSTDPQYSAGGVITFNGTTNRMETSGALATTQPVYVFMGVRSDTFSSLRRWFQSQDAATVYCRDITTSPDVQLRGSTVLGPNSGFTIGNWHAGMFKFDNTAGAIQVGSAGTPLTGTTGTLVLTGLSLGDAPGAGGAPKAMSVVELFICSGTTLSAEEITSALEYLEALLP